MYPAHHTPAKLVHARRSKACQAGVRVGDISVNLQRPLSEDTGASTSLHADHSHAQLANETGK